MKPARRRLPSPLKIPSRSLQSAGSPLLDSRKVKIMASGHISRLLPGEGYGFILEDGQSEEIEFHWSALKAGRVDQLTLGQRVEFDKRRDHRDEVRLRAVNVRLY
jgi:cold shock CspA family protein